MRGRSKKVREKVCDKKVREEVCERLDLPMANGHASSPVPTRSPTVLKSCRRISR